MSTVTIILLIKILGCVIVVVTVLYGVFRVSLYGWDNVFERKVLAADHRRREDIHQVRLDAMRWEAAGKQFRQIAAAPNTVGNWVMTMLPQGGIDIRQLNTAAERLLVAGRGVNVPDVILGAQDEPLPQLPTYCTPDQVMRGQSFSYRRLVLGVGIDGPVTIDMAKLVHGAVAGSSGWGKSMFLRWLVYQLVKSTDPVNLAFIDMEGVTLGPFEKSDRVLWPVAEDERGVMGIIGAIKHELDTRKALFGRYRDQGVDSLYKYNELVDPADRLVPIILIVDEAAALMLNPLVAKAIRELVWRSRKYGIWNFWAAQVWYSDTIPSGTSTMFGTAIHFHAEKASQGRVLGLPQAAEIVDVGRAFVRLPGRTVTEIQTPMMTDTWLQGARGNGPMYDMPLVDDDTIELALSAPPDETVTESRWFASVFAAWQNGLRRPTEICRKIGASTGGKPFYDVRSCIAYIQHSESSTTTTPATLETIESL